MKTLGIRADKSKGNLKEDRAKDDEEQRKK